MKTLSVRQPWAWLIVNGAKTVENRSWRTNYRGPLLIHVSKTIEREAIQALLDANPDTISKTDLAEMKVTGAVVGLVDVVDCTLSPTDDNDIIWHDPGYWAWVLRNPVLLVNPIPARGRLGLFDIPVSRVPGSLQVLGPDPDD